MLQIHEVVMCPGFKLFNVARWRKLLYPGLKNWTGSRPGTVEIYKDLQLDPGGSYFYTRLIDFRVGRVWSSDPFKTDEPIWTALRLPPLMPVASVDFGQELFHRRRNWPRSWSFCRYRILSSWCPHSKIPTASLLFTRSLSLSLSHELGESIAEML